MLGLRKFVEELFLSSTNSRSHVASQRREVRSAFLGVMACSLISSFAPSLGNAQVNVTTYHNDIGRTGQNLNETILNLSNVNTTQFGKLFTQTVDGQIYAQPLYMSGVTINGATHNVVYVATEHDSVYAFDADTNGGANSAPLWQASMLAAVHGAPTGATTIPSSVVGYDITPEIGITGTPVIDASTGTMYVVSKTYESNKAVQRLHALDITTGAEKFGGPVVLSASIAGTGNGSVNGTLNFDPLWESNRPGLLLLNGIVYIGFAAHGDNGPWHGWILGYKASTLVQTGAYCASPNGTGAGFWMSGEGLAADTGDPVNHPMGRIFAPTGNGDFNPAIGDYGDSHLVLDLKNGNPTVADYFTTNQQASLNSQDGDIGAGGMMVLPDQAGPTTHMAVQAGKGGTFYIFNRDNMGGYNNPDKELQFMDFTVGNVGAWSTPAYWNGIVYWWGRFDKLKSFPVVNGVVQGYSITSTEQYGYPGSTPSISANGNSQGIVWSINSAPYSSSGPAVLQAHDASKVSTTLYSSSTNTARDSAGTAVKFTVPTIANGKVFVGASGELDIYGLLNGITQTASPVISPGSQSYTGSVTVTITDATSGANIYYTLDGSAATPKSTLYTGPITVTSTETINAIGSANGLLLSAQSSATYTNVSQANAVKFSLPTGTYTTVQSLTLSDATANTTIYYTTDGSTPTTASKVYSTPITINSTEIVSAIATGTGLSASPVISNTYTIQLGATGISFSQGFAASAGIIINNGSSQLNDSRLQVTSGLSGQAGSAWYNTPVNVQAFTTDFTFQLSNPQADGMTFTIQNAPSGVSALGGNGYTLGYAVITKSLAIKFDLYDSAGEGPNSTGLYLNGANPTVPSISLAGTGIDLHSDDEMAIHLVYDGTTLTMTITDMVTSTTWSTNWTVNIPSVVGASTAYVGFTGSTGGLTASQKILTWTYFASAPASTAATPTFTPVNGTYTTAQTVTISDATSGASIYYTTDGSTPTTASTVYTAPFTVSTTKTIKALAAVPGSSSISPSAVATAIFTITSPAATPSFSPVAGNYSTAQNVTISDTTSGATIYYTTDGTTPTTASAVYSTPVAVAATKTLKAIASGSGFTSSAIATAAYTISSVAATPTFSPIAGTYSTAQNVTISDTTTGAKIYYTIDGSAPSTASPVYTAPIAVTATETIKSFVTASGYTASTVASATYTITSVTATPTFSPAAGTYTSAQTVAISDTNSGATIYYTTDGSAPTTASAVYTTPIAVSTTKTLKAMATVTGSSSYTPSAVATAAYTINLPAATPSISPAAGTYNTAQTVTISDTSTGATIYYTTDGSTPTTASAVYAAPLSVTTTQTLKAIAGGTGFSASPVATAAYVITSPAATPSFSPAAGSYTSIQNVTITDATAGTTIYYTTNGTTPTTSSAMYSGPIAISSTETLKAIAAAPSNPSITASAPTSGTYTITLPAAAAPAFSPGSSNSPTPITMSISDATNGATIYYTTDDSMPTAGSTVYSGSVVFTTTTTVKAVAILSGYKNSAVSTAVYTISPRVASPVLSLPAGTYAGPQMVTVTDATPGAKIYYTLDKTAPNGNSPLYTGPITINSSMTIQTIAFATGYSGSLFVSAAYTITSITAAPTFSVVSGTYPSAQTVNLTDATPGATIYYTTDGSIPTTSSTVYGGAITVTTNKTINAIALAPGNSPSGLATASYTISSATPAVNFPSGFTSTSLNLVGGTSISGTALQLTDGGVTEAHAAWFATPVNIQKFTTDFNFQIPDSTADGLTFAIQNNAKGVNAVGASGTYLGYGTMDTSVAVKFDLYSNSGEGNNSTGFYSGGATPTEPSVDMTSSDFDLHSGNLFQAHITYDGVNLILTLTDTKTGATFTTSSAMNIPSLVGKNTAYVGFTGGTGSKTATQNILNWTYAVN